MANQFDIHFKWIPEHRDIIRYCAAHELARLGTTSAVSKEREDGGVI